MSAEIYEQHAQINFYLANLLTGTVNEKVVGDIDLDKSKKKEKEKEKEKK